MIDKDEGRVDFSSAARMQLATKPMLVSDRKLSYGELDIRIHKLTKLFDDAGLKEGSRVILSSHNEQYMVEWFLALLLNGITAVILDPESTLKEANGIVERADPDGIVVDKELWEKWGLESVSEGMSLAMRIASPPAVQNNLLWTLLKKKQHEDASCYPCLVDCLEGKPPRLGVSADTVAYILFTSGTTSQPKGVEISAGALHAHLRTLSQQFSYDFDTRILNVLPLSHADGLVQGPVVAYFNGASVCRPCRFSAQTMVEVLDSIYRERVTHMVAVPAMLAMMSRLGDELAELFAGNDFRFIISAAAYLEPDLWKNIESLTGRRVANIYGLTETVTGSLFNGPDDESRRIGTLGKPIDCKVRIISEDGVEVATGGSGELLIAGPHLMSGYFRDEKGSAEVMNNGWLHTGDLVSIDAEGFCHYVGRKKNIIISGGRNVIPEQVSSVLLEHPEVAEAVVIGVPEADWGEVVVACVVTEKESSVDAAQLIEFCRCSLSAYKVPHRVVIVPALQRGRTGKVKLDAVHAMLAGNDDYQVKIGSVAQRVVDVAAHIFQTTVDSLSLASNTGNTAGWDSLGHMFFMTALEAQFGISLTTRDIISINSLAAAVDIVEARQREA